MKRITGWAKMNVRLRRLHRGLPCVNRDISRLKTSQQSEVNFDPPSILKTELCCRLILQRVPNYFCNRRSQSHIKKSKHRHEDPKSEY